MRGSPCRSLGYGLCPPLGMTIEAAPAYTRDDNRSLRFRLGCHWGMISGDAIGWHRKWHPGRKHRARPCEVGLHSDPPRQKKLWNRARWSVWKSTWHGKMAEACAVEAVSGAPGTRGGQEDLPEGAEKSAWSALQIPRLRAAPSARDDNRCGPCLHPG